MDGNRLEAIESSDDMLSRITVEHEDLKTRLRQLDKHVYLTPDEQVERKQIQKLKLRKKDQIQSLKRH
jgi:hypothetical protein